MCVHVGVRVCMHVGTHVCVCVYEVSRDQEVVFTASSCFCFALEIGSLYLCGPGCPPAHYVDQVGLELSDPRASAALVLGLTGWYHRTWLVSI